MLRRRGCRNSGFQGAAVHQSGTRRATSLRRPSGGKGFSIAACGGRLRRNSQPASRREPSERRIFDHSRKLQIKGRTSEHRNRSGRMSVPPVGISRPGTRKTTVEDAQGFNAGIPPPSMEQVSSSRFQSSSACFRSGGVGGNNLVFAMSEIGTDISGAHTAGRNLSSFQQRKQRRIPSSKKH